MGKNDTYVKGVFEDSAACADVYNIALFRGEKVISKDNVHELDTSQTVFIEGDRYLSHTPHEKRENNNNKTNKSRRSKKRARYTRQLYRDVLRIVELDGEKLPVKIIIGIENQMKIHYAMPVRNMLYDAVSYSNQVKTIAKHNKKNKLYTSSEEYLSGFMKSDKLIPVITIVVYLGLERWDGAYSIHDMIDWSKLPKQLKELIPDYRMLLIEPSSIDEECINSCESEVGNILGAIKHSTNEKEFSEFLTEHPLFSNDAAALLNEVCKLDIPEEILEEKEVVDVCQAVIEIRESGRREGRSEGLSEGMKIGLISTIEATMKYGATFDEAVDEAASRMNEDREKVIEIWNTRER